VGGLAAGERISKMDELLTHGGWQQQYNRARILISLSNASATPCGIASALSPLLTFPGEVVVCALHTVKTKS
jgi:hypothetical protein